MIYIGLDLGKAADYTAVAAVQAVKERLECNDSAGMPMFGTFLHCRHLHRYQLNTMYTEIVDDMASMVNHPELKRDGYLLIPDATGVGAPVIELLAQRKIKQMPIYIIGLGKEHVDEDSGYMLIPKRDLITNLVVAFETSQIKFAKGLEYERLITDELTNFRMKKTKAANDIFEAREGEHDDLVLALSLAVYFAKRHRWTAQANAPVKHVHPLERMKGI